MTLALSLSLSPLSPSLPSLLQIHLPPEDHTLCDLLKVYPRLGTVDLSHNQLTSVTPDDLGCVGRLGRLDLRHNRLTRLSWEKLEQALRSESLSVVYLSNNSWNCEYEERTMQFWVSDGDDDDDDDDDE